MDQRDLNLSSFLIFAAVPFVLSTVFSQHFNPMNGSLTTFLKVGVSIIEANFMLPDLWKSSRGGI